MATVTAVHMIAVSDPAAQWVHSGRFNKDGNAIMNKSSLMIQPGQIFEYDDGPELDKLLSGGAVRHPTDAELALYNATGGRN